MSERMKTQKSSEYQVLVGKELNAESFQLAKDGGSISINNSDIAKMIQSNVKDFIASKQDLAAVKVGVSVDF